jgi:hypothetical protein
MTSSSWRLIEKLMTLGASVDESLTEQLTARGIPFDPSLTERLALGVSVHEISHMLEWYLEVGGKLSSLNIQIKSIANDGNTVNWREDCTNYAYMIDNCTDIDHRVIRVEIPRCSMLAYAIVPADETFIPNASECIDGLTVTICDISSLPDTSMYTDVMAHANDGKLVKWTDCINYKHVVARQPKTREYVPIRIVEFEKKDVPAYCLFPLETKFVQSADYCIDGYFVRMKTL